MDRILPIPYVRARSRSTRHSPSSVMPTACSTSVTVSFSFGGNTWTMSPADFAFTSISSTECIGAFFEMTSTAGTTAPSWIIGDAFLVRRDVDPLACVLMTHRHRKTSTRCSDTTRPLLGSLPSLKSLSLRTASTALRPHQRLVVSPRRSPTATLTVPCLGSNSVSGGAWFRVLWRCSWQCRCGCYDNPS